jgi:hypothetical protein
MIQTSTKVRSHLSASQTFTSILMYYLREGLLNCFPNLILFLVRLIAYWRIRLPWSHFWGLLYKSQESCSFLQLCNICCEPSKNLWVRAPWVISLFWGTLRFSWKIFPFMEWIEIFQKKNLRFWFNIFSADFCKSFACMSITHC